MVDQASSLRRKVEAKSKNTRIIAVASGKGGVGKTNIVVNLGISLREKGQRVLLLDADLGMANIDILLGLTSRYDLHHVLKGRCKFEDAILEGPGGIDILPGTSGVDDLINISSAEVKRLIEASALMEANYDIILIDVGAGIHMSVTNFIKASDEALIVLTPEPTAIMDAYSLIKYLANHNFKDKVGLIINQTTSKKEGNDIAERMKKVINEYLQMNIEIVGNIPYDISVRQAVKEQIPLILHNPHSKVVEALREVADRVLNITQESEARGMKSFIYRVVGIFNRDLSNFS